MVFHNCCFAKYGVYVRTRAGLRVFSNVEFLDTEGSLVEKIQENADSEEQRVKELETIRKRLAELERGQKLGLAWRDISEDVETLLRDEMPVLIHEPDLDIPGKIPSDQSHTLIEGDNLHALHVLQATHKGAIDIIYIDPPYNTGSHDFIYNDKYVDLDDDFRHSKWLSFMEKRLRLAKKLLKDDGIVFISIDDGEQAHLRILCDKIFGERNFVCQFIIDKTAQGANQSATFKKTHEYCLLYTSGLQNMIDSDIETGTDEKKYKFHDDRGLYAVTNSFDSINSPLSANKNRGYTIYYNEKTADAEIRTEYDRTHNTFNNFDKDLIKKGFTPIRPGIRKGVQYPWNWTSARFLADYKRDLVFMKNKKGQLGVYHKNRATGKTKDTTIKRFDTRNFGNQLLVNILGERKFDYPKSLDMMTWVISKHKSKSALVLDFFAGSGTTGHAVLEINKIDGGNRRFIICTNNENDICRDVTQLRLKAVLTGKWADKQKHDPLPGSLSFYKTGFIKRLKSPDRMRTEISKHTIDLIAIKEGAGTTVSRTADLTVLHGLNKTIAVVPGLDPDHVKICANAEKKVRDGDHKIVYLFTWSNQGVEEEIAALWPSWVVQPLPSEMLAALRRNAPVPSLFDVDGGAR